MQWVLKRSSIQALIRARCAKLQHNVSSAFKPYSGFRCAPFLPKTGHTIHEGLCKLGTYVGHTRVCNATITCYFCNACEVSPEALWAQLVCLCTREHYSNAYWFYTPFPICTVLGLSWDNNCSHVNEQNTWSSRRMKASLSQHFDSQ